MKIDESNLGNVAWTPNVDLHQLTHEEYLPVIGSCQVSSILSNLDPSEKDLRYVFCDLCPFFSTKEHLLIQHLQNMHKNGNTIKMTKLKCPACMNIFYHKVSLRYHLIYDHLVSSADLGKIMQVTTTRKAVCDKTVESNVIKTDLPSSSVLCKNELDLNYVDKLANLNTEKILNEEEVNVSTGNDIVTEITANNCLNKDVEESVPTSIIVNLPTMDRIEIENFTEAPDKKYNNYSKRQNTLSKFLDNKRMHKCNVPLCKVRLQNLEKLTYHVKCHVDTSFKCPECNDIFSFWKPLTGHLWRMHKIDMELYSCDICDYKTFSLGKLNNVHKLIHGDTKPFICDQCTKAFKNMKQLRNHKTSHREKSEIATYFCELCSKAFSDRRQLRIHTDGVHNKIKPYLCNFCGYKGATRSALRMHMRQHTGEKPFACDSCMYTTSDHNSLRRHKLRHSGEKPYKCSHCEYACIQSSTYKVHLKTKHPGLEQELLFSCSKCSFRSINKDMFNTHVSTVHNQKVV